MATITVDCADGAHTFEHTIDDRDLSMLVGASADSFMNGVVCTECSAVHRLKLRGVVAAISVSSTVEGDNRESYTPAAVEAVEYPEITPLPDPDPE